MHFFLVCVQVGGDESALFVAGGVFLDAGGRIAFIQDVDGNAGHQPRPDAVLLHHGLRFAGRHRQPGCRGPRTPVWKLLFVSRYLYSYLELKIMGLSKVEKVVKK